MPTGPSGSTRDSFRPGAYSQGIREHYCQTTSPTTGDSAIETEGQLQMEPISARPGGADNKAAGEKALTLRQENNCNGW